MYECEHCHKTYVNNRYYLKHFNQCKIYLRKHELSTVIGKNAFNYYKKWLKSKQCMNDDSNTFITSRFYNSFIKFSKFVVDKKIVDIDLYFDYMIIKKINPMIWTNDIIYSVYIKLVDDLSPMDSVNLSIKTLIKLGKIFDCEPYQVMKKLSISEIIELLYSRHFTPWFLLNSNDITNILNNPDISKSQHIILEGFINPKIWTKKFKDNSIELSKVKDYLKNLNL